MHINFEEKQGIFIFRINGIVDINTSPEFKKAFDHFINEDHNKIVIDLTDVGYIDSSGLATLVEIFKKLRNAGGKFKLVGLSEKIKGLFEITKLDKLFDIKKDEEEAINSF